MTGVATSATVTTASLATSMLAEAVPLGVAATSA